MVQLAPRMKVEVEDPLEDEHGPLDKRPRMSHPFHQWGAGAGAGVVSPYNLLEEPSPLGLRLRKSPSLLDLIQMRLSKADSAAVSSVTSSGNVEGGRRDLNSTAVSSNSDKMKASNFSVSLLRIGTWERVSRHEVDLVAKCYFAKHKLVWEVLDGGLKSKIEIQWSDITALKATLPENGPGTLEIALARQPLFFREMNPQPRKHTLWQATADFTGGQASMHRRHFLQCAQGLLNKNFEKLIQCDPRLNALSRRPEIILESQHFEPRCPVLKDEDETKSRGFDKMSDACASTISGFRDLGSPSITPSVSTGSEVTLGRMPDNTLWETTCHSVMDAQIIDSNSSKRTEEFRSSRHWDQVKVLPVLGGSMSMSDLVNHIGHCISEQTTSGNPLLSADGSPNEGMLENVAQYLLGDSQISPVADEKSIMARVNSLYCLLQKDANTFQSMHMDGSNPAAVSIHSNGKPLSHAGLASERRPIFDFSTSERKPLFDLWTADESSDASVYKQPPPSVSRKESFGDLLMYLPRIASMPRVLFNITEDHEE